ncbi:AsmA family protein [Pontibacter ruber]|uniref:AsmA family protein n=1 Tax=Pontibacter ruber TaxID=1343895 RepID=A0ABW5CZJ4_9BACT|nr:AsmA family protein [Pontibacter ruber]
MKFHRFIKFSLIVVGLVLSLVLVVLLMLPMLYQEKAPALLRQKFESSSDMVLAPFQMEISSWRNFPYLTFSIDDVALVDTSNNRSIEVLRIKHAEALVSVLQWPFGVVRVSKVYLDGLVFHQQVDSTGKKIGLSFRERESATDASGDVSLHIPHVRIRNARILSENHYKKGAFSIQLLNSDLALEVRNNALNLKGKLNGKIDYIASRELRLFQDKKFTADAFYTYDLKKKLGRIQNSKAILNGNEVLISGTHQKPTTGPGAELDLHFQGDQPFFFLLNQMESVRSIPLLKRVKSEGRVKLHYHIAGNSSPMQRPRSRLYFALQDGKLHWPTSRITLSHIQIAGQLDNGPEHSPESSSFTLHNLSARSGTDSVQLKATITNFTEPFVDAHLSGSYTLDSLAQVLPPTYIALPKGTLAGNIAIKGNLHANDGRKKEQDLQWKGAISLQNVAFRPANLTVACTEVNGKAVLTGNELRLPQFSGKVGGEPFSVTGSVKDVMNYLLGQSPTITVDGAVRLKQVNTAWIKLEAGAEAGRQKKAVASTVKTDNSILPAFLRLNMRLQCEQLELEKATIRKMHARLRSNGNRLTLSDIGLTTQGITVKGNLSVPNNSRQLHAANLQLSANLDSLDLTSMQQINALANTSGRDKAAEATQKNGLAYILPLQKAQLSVHVRNVNLPGNEDMKNFSLQLNKNRNHVTMRDMRFTTSKGGKATASGGFQLNKSKLTKPYLDVAMQYKFLDLQAFMQNFAALKTLLPPPDTASTPARADGKYKFKEKAYDLSLYIKAGELKYEYLRGANLAINARMNREQAQLDRLYLDAFGGMIYAHGLMDLNEPTDTVPVRLKAQVQDVDLKQIFAFAEQMELDVLGSRNIEGKADCNLTVFTKLDQTFTPSFDRTVAYTKATFRGMELKDIMPIQEALGFMRKERTEHLYFEDVNADFVLYKNKFLTPGFSLNNNLSSFDLRGSYTMKGNANLSMDVNVLNILFGNNERRIEQIQEDSLALKSNKRQQHLLLVREQDKYKVKLSNRKERESITDTLRNEFTDVLNRYQIDTVFTVVK